MENKLMDDPVVVLQTSNRFYKSSFQRTPVLFYKILIQYSELNHLIQFQASSSKKSMNIENGNKYSKFNMKECTSKMSVMI